MHHTSSTGKLQRLQTRTRLASTTSSSETLNDKLRKCSRCDATQLRRITYTPSKLCLTIFIRLEISSSTPFTRYGHPCTPNHYFIKHGNDYWEASMVKGKGLFFRNAHLDMKTNHSLCSYTCFGTLTFKMFFIYSADTFQTPEYFKKTFPRTSTRPLKLLDQAS